MNDAIEEMKPSDIRECLRKIAAIYDFIDSDVPDDELRLDGDDVAENVLEILQNYGVIS